MSKKPFMNARLTLSLTACAITFDFLSAISGNDRLKLTAHSKEFKRSIALYVALLFSGIDQGNEVPKYYNEQHDIESMIALTFGKNCSREELIEMFDKLQADNRRDIRNCICHGLFDFAKTHLQNRRVACGFALRPNRSRNKSKTPLFICEEDIEVFVEKQIKQKMCLLTNASEEEYRNACISKLALLTAKQYSKSNKIIITPEMNDLLDKYGMEFLSSVIGSILFVYNQNTLYDQFKDDADSKEVFCTVRNSLCHGNFNKHDGVKIEFQDPGSGTSYSMNVWEMMQAVSYYLVKSKKGVVMPNGVKLVDFIQYMQKSKNNEDTENAQQ